VNYVITPEQAKQITRGRTPLVPVEYEQAVKALQACVTLDEAKHWSDKAEALAVWARIYHNDEVGRKARALKLHAWRRMGQLAALLRPQLSQKGKRGGVPGPISLLVERGICRGHAQMMRNLAKATDEKFQSAVTAAKPPSPWYFTCITQGNPSAGSARLRQSGYPQFRSFCKNSDPVEVARALRGDEIGRIRDEVIAVMEWLDSFENALPKYTVDR
jgi:hypothetical protein